MEHPLRPAEKELRTKRTAPRTVERLVERLAIPAKLIESEIADATTISTMKALDRLLIGLDYRGKPVYLPPSKTQTQAPAKVFVPAVRGNKLPPQTETEGDKLVTRNPEGLSLTPPGEALANLLQEKLAVKLNEVDLDHLASHLPRILVEELQLMKGFRLTRLGETIHIRIEGSAHASLCTSIEKETAICQTLGCPLTSAIAITLARTTRKPITIDTVETSDDHRTMEAWYGILK